LHDVAFSRYTTIFFNTILVVCLGGEAWSTWQAVLAFEHLGALLTVVVASGSVDGALLIGDTVVLHVLEGSQLPSTVASITGIVARDHLLWGDIDIWPSSISSDLDSIREG